MDRDGSGQNQGVGVALGDAVELGLALTAGVASGSGANVGPGDECCYRQGWLTESEKATKRERVTEMESDWPPWLAHIASWEAIQAVEGMFTGHKPRRIRVFPGCTYCQPQVASVGLTERAATEKG